MRNAFKTRPRKIRRPRIFLCTTGTWARFSGEISRKPFVAGVKMSFGTDAGVCPHGINARQFAFMVKYGMTPMQAIQSATSNAADLLGSRIFSALLQPGKYADIIAVPGILSKTSGCSKM